ncbi:MAG TPA: hypothetical protein VNO50_10090 [Pyrinomonadaceae bacterium]|nr:hypothetical protein [Pyrinomonadaceae bacterium]
MQTADSVKTDLDNLIKEAELEKLKLEISEVRNNNKWGRGITQYLPLISVMIAIGGFLFGIYEFKKKSAEEQKQATAEQIKDRETRKADQTIRIQNQVRSDLEQLYQFTKKDQTISQARFILADLKAYLDIDKDLDSKLQAKRIRDITTNLMASVKEDCDFDRLRDVQFARTLLNEWEDSKPYLAEDKWMNEHILIKYRNALRTVYGFAPVRLQNMTYDGEQFFPSNKDEKLEARQITHLEEVVWGSYKHMQLMPSGKERDRSIKAFQAATCNPILTEQLFGMKFEQKDDDTDLNHCPKPQKPVVAPG